MTRRLTSFEGALVTELATIAALLVDRLNEPRDDDGPEYLALSSVTIREVIDIAVRTAAARKRLARFRRLRYAAGHDDPKLQAEEFNRLRLGELDLDTPFDSSEVKP